MAQLFPKWSNSAARAVPVAAVILSGGAIALGMVLVRGPYVTRQNIPREQPIAFSHLHHVGEIGIDCRYCHTSVEESAFANVPPTQICMNCHRYLWSDSPELAGVRDSWRTGEPIRWERVHDVPDYVYFNHSVHVAKGVGCVECHGKIDEMPLTWRVHSLQMKWCLDCHRDPIPHLRPAEFITSTRSLDELARSPDYQAVVSEMFPRRDSKTVSADEVRDELGKRNAVQRLTDCYTCHR